MLKGAGLHQNFGWKPIGKYEFTTPGGTHTINPLPCTFDRTIKMFSKWDNGQVGIRINNDGGNNYAWAIHRSGLSGGALHTQVAAITTSIYLTQYEWDEILIETTFEAYGNLLRVISHAWAYLDATHFGLFSVGGMYNQAGPYTRMDFVNGSMRDMVGEIQFFESVYGF